jgi:hypothetical protein
MTYRPPAREFFPSFPWAALALGALDGGDWRKQANLVLAHPLSKYLPPQERSRLTVLAYDPDPLRCPTDLKNLRKTTEMLIDLEVTL